MTFIHGGGYQFGWGDQKSYDGTNYAAYQDVVIVTMNYRLGLFGFPNRQDVLKQTRNLGLLDQRLALDWVQRNIAAFGGDPEKVTIFGESAGAHSVSAQTFSVFPSGKTPFRAAIMESGQSVFGVPPIGSSPSLDSVAKMLNCTGTTLQCLKSMDGTTLAGFLSQHGLSFGPVTDDLTILSNITEKVSSGQLQQIPTLVGTNMNEGRAFVFGQPNNTEAFLSQLLGNNTAEIQKFLAAYPIGEHGLVDDFEVMGQILTDQMMQCVSTNLSF